MFSAKKNYVSSSLLWLLISMSLCIHFDPLSCVLKLDMSMIKAYLISHNSVEF